MIRLFTGFDQRESVGWHVFAQSVIDRSSVPVCLIPLTPKATKVSQRDGSNSFTYSRFLIPWYCNYEGFAIFGDGADQLLLADLAELWELRSGWFGVQVVKHEYKTRHPRKYIGTEMESDNRDYPRKNWSSLVIWNCGHYMNRVLTPEFIASKDGAYLHRFGWLPADRIGELPAEWNWLADETGPSNEAKLLHWTAGIPGISAYASAPHASAWKEVLERVNQQPKEFANEIV